MKYAIVIPARFESSRFPGKPLASILGKPMIQWVYEKCVSVLDPKDVYIATDHEGIRQCVEGFGGQVLMTSNRCLTGTDRIAEAALDLDYEFFVNVQGDEPMISPKDIEAVISQHKSSPSHIFNAYATISSESDFRSSSVPKVVVGQDGQLLYISRAAIPTNKDLGFIEADRQVCIYIFSKKHLEFFGNSENKSPIEEIEDIEILRFLEAGYSVKMVRVDNQSLAVDYPEDLARVENLLA